MKAIKGIINVFLAFLLTILIIVNSVIYLFSNTILSENYIYDLLEEKDYYGKFETELRNKFEEYQYQSGLSEEIFENLYSTEMIRNDLNSIIAGIYEENEIVNSSETLRSNLTENINEYLAQNNMNLNEVQQNNIDIFEDLVVQAYEKNITISENIIRQILSTKEKISNILIFAKIGFAVGLIVVCIFTLIVNIKFVWGFVNSIMISLLSSGILAELMVWLIHKNIQIDYLVLLTQFLSDFMKEVIFDILGKIQTAGMIYIIIGVLGIIISSYEKAERQQKNEG